MLSIPAAVLLLLAALTQLVQAIPTISAVGSKFFTSAGNQWFIKGVAYQLTEDDPLVNAQQCQLDATLMKQLGANAIRVYHVDASADHTACMNIFAQAGIYLFVDMDSFKTYIRYDDSAAWTQNKSDSYRAVMDNFQQYDNTAGFFVGNEVLNVLADAEAAPFLLAAAADLKGYAAAKGYRKIPVGYSATDTAVLRPMLQDYLVCRPNATERLDFYALNSYEWCGAAATYQTSGYSQLQADAADYPVPIFFSEDGCNTVPPRDFNDQSAIFGPDMVGTWSGAIIYEWIQETNEYGLVSYGPQQGANVNDGSSIIQGFVRQGTPTPVLPDFTNLQAQWATLMPSGVASSAYAAHLTDAPPACPASTAGGWTIDPNAALPTIGVAGVTAGTPSGIPRGSITGTPSSSLSSTSASTLTSTTGSSATSQSTGTSGSTTGSATGSATAATSAATSKGAAGKTSTNPVSIAEPGLVGMVIALMTVGAGVMLWL